MTLTNSRCYGDQYLPLAMGAEDGERLMMAFIEAGYPEANVEWFDGYGWLVEVLRDTAPPMAVRERAYALVTGLLPRQRPEDITAKAQVRPSF